MSAANTIQMRNEVDKLKDVFRELEDELRNKFAENDHVVDR